MLTLEFRDGVVVELSFVAVAFTKRLPYPTQHFVIERDPLQDAGELLLQHLLSRVRLLALSLEARAVIERKRAQIETFAGVSASVHLLGHSASWNGIKDSGCLAWG